MQMFSIYKFNFNSRQTDGKHDFTAVLSLEHTKPMVGRRAVFESRPTKSSQCVPHCRLKLVLVGFVMADLTC